MPFANCVSSMRKCSSSTSSSAASSRRSIARSWRRWTSSVWRSYATPPSRRRGSERGRARRRASPPGSSRCGTPQDEDAVEHRVGAHHARALAEVTLEQVDRALEADMSEAVAVRIASWTTARSSTRGVQDVDGSALLELHRGEDRDGRDEIRHDEHAAGLPAAHLDEAGEAEHAKRLAQGRLRDPEPLGGERSLVREPIACRRPARSIASVRCSIAASNVRVARIGSTEKRTVSAIAVSLAGSRPIELDSKTETLFHLGYERGFRHQPGPPAGDRARGRADRRPAGLDDDALLAMHRSLVRLRTYDERSVVYHRQGRIGTYAIFRGHEAVQAGAVHALEDRDFGSSRATATRRSACCGGCRPPRSSSGGAVIRPAGGTRRT